MPKIVLNPRLENNIKIVEFREYFNAPPDKQEELMRYYEDGYLLVLRGYRFEAGREVLLLGAAVYQKFLTIMNRGGASLSHWLLNAKN